MSKKKIRQPIDIDAAYIRVSHVDIPEREPEARKKAIDELVAVRAEEIREAAARIGKSISNEHLYIDMDLSGTSIEKRPAMTQMLAAAQKGLFARIWVKNLSRLFRNITDQTVYIDRIEKAGVRIITLQEPTQGDKATVDLMRNILGSVNQYQAAQTGQVIRANNRIVASMGRLVGGQAPLGYIYNSQSKQLLADPARKDDAMMVFRIFVQEKTLAGTAAILNHMGILTRKNTYWRHKKVRDILENPIYRGMVHYAGEQWPGQHEKIIPDELIAEADRILASRTRASGNLHGNRNDGSVYTYSRILTCGLCGANIRIQPIIYDGERYNYWICSARKDKRICDLPTYKTKELDVFVLEAIRLALVHELSSIKHFMSAPNKTTPIVTMNRDVEAERAIIEAKRARASVEYSEGWMEQLEYRTLVAKYRTELENLETVDEKVVSSQTKKVTVDDIMDFRNMFTESWKTASEAERREFISRVVKNILIYPDKLIVRTLMSLGDITIPTLMFEKLSPAQNESEAEPNFWRGAPGRTGAIAP
jgi:site-specific DNA recombinase